MERQKLEGAGKVELEEAEAGVGKELKGGSWKEAGLYSKTKSMIEETSHGREGRHLTQYGKSVR